VARAHALKYEALAITDDCSLSGVVRAHAQAKELGLHLIIGAQMLLTPPPPRGRADEAEAAGREDEEEDDDEAGDAIPATPDTPARLVLLAQTRRGYGNLSRWITVARRRAPKGSYLAHPGDLEGRVPNAPFLAGLPECLALLVPSATQPFDAVFAQAIWLKAWFQDRAAIALALLHRAGDADLIDCVRQVSQLSGV